VKRENELYSFRRHLRRCRFFGPGGREARADKCQCPFHVDGLHRGERVRQSLRTRSRQVADLRLAELVRKIDDQRRTAGDESLGNGQRTVKEAVERFLRNHGAIDAYRKFQGSVEYATWRKYRTKLNLLLAFCDTEGIPELADATVDVLEDFRQTRKIGLVTWKVELQALRTFFGYFCQPEMDYGEPSQGNQSTAQHQTERGRPAHAPGGKRDPDRLRSNWRCGATYQRTAAVYERLRARAMVLLLRHTALRISDVCTLRKDAVSWDEANSVWRVWVRTQKSGEPVFLPVPENLKFVLDALPLPRNAPEDCPYFFWNGQTAKRAVAGIAERTLAAVFKKSGVKNAYAHRYRHTLATRLLE
jgi:integrase